MSAAAHAKTGGTGSGLEELLVMWGGSLWIALGCCTCCTCPQYFFSINWPDSQKAFFMYQKGPLIPLKLQPTS